MNKYLKCFLHRGLVFGGFGPIIAGVIYLILSRTLPDVSASGDQLFVIILSTYILAFVQAGASVFNQIESWPLPKSLLCHFSALYIAYIGCYLINTWIPFDVRVILIFTAVFVTVYFVIWISVYFAVKATTKKFNSRLNK